MVGPDSPPNTTATVETHHPRKGLCDWNLASRASSRLNNLQHDCVTGLHRVFDLDVQSSDGLGKSLKKVADLLTVVVFADFILEVDTGMDESIECGS